MQFSDVKFSKIPEMLILDRAKRLAMVCELFGRLLPKWRVRAQQHTFLPILRRDSGIRGLHPHLSDLNVTKMKQAI